MSLADHDRADDLADTVALLVAERDSLRRYVAGLIGRDPHTVEDVVQETLLRAWQSAPLLEWRDRPIRMWLFRVARNLVADRVRRNRTVPVGVTAEDFAAAGTASVPDHADEVGDRCVLVAALHTLAPAHREAVARVHLLGEAGEDVARRLGVPRGTVKSRTHHGIRALRDELGARGYGRPATGGSDGKAAA
ncbi:sigma-70 family RNA polymerase sigma factor [Streptomyces sp. NPDC088732]|uniref:sigma-70 family RNA polymerase sigma factor n=1 Tax=Streptomyces sp. NPDC088732 TaxID=3365879 RepID=UPI003813DA4E